MAMLTRPSLLTRGLVRSVVVGVLFFFTHFSWWGRHVHRLAKNTPSENYWLFFLNFLNVTSLAVHWNLSRSSTYREETQINAHARFHLYYKHINYTYAFLFQRERALALTLTVNKKSLPQREVQINLNVNLNFQ